MAILNHQLPPTVRLHIKTEFTAELSAVEHYCWYRRERVPNLFGTDRACLLLSRSGSLSDPANISGLAHFCEHMLFLGTKKYPKENEYSQFLSEHAGSSNAFTSAEHTNYYFDVSHEHLQGALDR